MAYLRFENPETQAEIERFIASEPGWRLEVVRRWRWFGESALRGSLDEIERLLRARKDYLEPRRGRLAILPQSEEERRYLEELNALGDLWEMEG